MIRDGSKHNLTFDQSLSLILLSSGAMRRSHLGMSDDMGSEDSRIKACPLVNAELAFVFAL